MSNAKENPAEKPAPRLAAAMRDVKNALADRDDVVVEMREAERMRLELLAAELEPVIAEVPADVELFDFAVSSGLKPRLWVDAVSHVGMGRDRRTYRFVRDSRLGRVVLAESTDMKPVAEQVTRYVAERLVERQRMMDGGPVRAEGSDSSASENSSKRWKSVLSGLLLILAGGAVGFLVVGALLWDRIAAMVASS